MTPSRVTLDALVNGSEFDVTEAYIGVTFPATRAPTARLLLTRAQFFGGRDQLPLRADRTGYVQVVYTRTDGQSTTTSAT
jgi:hypothetical protein